MPPDRGVRPHFEVALTAWENGMSAKAAGLVNQLPGDEPQRQRQGAGTRQQQARGVIGGGKQVTRAAPKDRVQSKSTSGSGVAGIARAWLGSWVSAFSTAYRDLGVAYEEGKRR